MRPRFRSSSSPDARRPGGRLELVRVRGAQRSSGPEGPDVRSRARRRGGRGRGRRARSSSPPRRPWWSWLAGLFTRAVARPARRPRQGAGESFDQQEARAVAEFSRHFRITFHDPGLLRLALTHRSYLSVTGMGPRESNERLEFLGDSVLGLVTSESLYRHHPEEHEGQLTKTKSLLVSKAILSRRALHIGLGRFILMSNSEVESGGRKRPSILADAFEAVLGAIYLDQGFEAGRRFVEEYLLRGSREIVADKEHRNYKSQLQEYVQSTFHTHPVYRIRSQMGPDHSKLFLVEVMVGRRVLGEGRGTNKKEAEQAAARDAMEGVAEPGGRRGEERGQRPARDAMEGVAEPGSRRGEERGQRPTRDAMERVAEPGGRRGEERGQRPTRAPREEQVPPAEEEEREESGREGRRGDRGRRGRPRPDADAARPAAGVAPPPAPPVARDEDEIEPRPGIFDEDDIEEVGRPEGPLDAWDDVELEAMPPEAPALEPAGSGGFGDGETSFAEEGDLEPPESPADGSDLGEPEGEPPLSAAEEPGDWERAEDGAAPPETEPDASPRFGRRRTRRR